MSSSQPAVTSASSSQLPLAASSYPLSTPHNALHRWSLSTRTIANYVRLEQIGEGTYGQVYRARPIDERGPVTSVGSSHGSSSAYVALKKIRLHHPGYWGIPPTVLREIKILKMLSHPNMVQMLEVVSSKGVESYDWEDVDTRTKKNDATSAITAVKDSKHINNINTTNDMDVNTTPMPSAESTALKQLADGGNGNNNSSKAKKKKDYSAHDVLRESYKGSLFLVLEYIEHDLTGLLDMAFKFSEVQAKSLMWQLLDVLEYMHERKFVHRDLKSSNLLITKNFQVKLADFGLARCLDDGNPRMISSDARDRDYSNEGEFTNKVITLWYRPPELLLGETRYGTAVDIWSAGCILAEIILGRPIFTGKTEMDQLKLIFDLIGTPTKNTWDGFNELKLIRTGEVSIEKVKRPKLREKYGGKIQPVSALNLLEKLLELDPKKRISARAALNHRYFRVEPLIPSDPSELGTIDLGDGNDGSGYHEFQTKKRRREAKAVAKQAEDEAKRRGEDVEKQKEAFDKAYREHLKKGAERDKEKTKLREKLEKHKRELEIQDQELQLEMQMFPQQRELEQQQDGLKRMQQQHNPPQQRHQGGWNPSQHHPGNPQRQQYDRSWNPDQSRQQGHPDDRYNPSYQNQPYPQQQRNRFNQQPNRPAQMDDRRQNAPTFDRNGPDNWQQRSYQPPYDRNSGGDWQQQNQQQHRPPIDRNGADDRQHGSQHHHQQKPPFDRNAREQWREGNQDKWNQSDEQQQSQQQQRAPFERNSVDQWLQGGVENRHQSQPNQQFERNRRDDRYGSRQQHSFDRDGRRDHHQPSFDIDGRRDQQQPRFNRNNEDNRYRATHQGSFDRDGRSNYRDGPDQSMQPPGDRRATVGGPSYKDSRSEEFYRAERSTDQRADGDRNMDDPGTIDAYKSGRRDNRPPADAAFRHDDNRRSDGWEDREHVGHYGDPQRHQDPRHDTRNAPNRGQSQYQRYDGDRYTAVNDHKNGFDGDKNGNEYEQPPKDESSQNIHDPLLETEISLEAAEDLILRDFGSKGKDDYEKHKSSRKNDDRHERRERSADGERRHRHRDKSDDSREHMRSQKHERRHRSRDEEYNKSRDDKVDTENDAAKAEKHAVDTRDRSLSAKGDGHAGNEYQRTSEHRSSSRHRKRDGDDSSYREHRHKRSRHDGRHRSDQHRSLDDRYRSDRHERRRYDRPGESEGGRGDHMDSAPPSNSELDRFGNPVTRSRGERDDRRY
ncbi:hypothetical protein ACHAXN_005163 [Cyclotella atomus]